MVGDRHVGTLLRIVEPLVAGPAGVEAPCPSHGTAPRMQALGTTYTGQERAIQKSVAVQERAECRHVRYIQYSTFFETASL